MIAWAVTFWIVALISAYLGFSGVAGDASWISKVLFVAFTALTVVSLFFAAIISKESK